MFYIILIAGYFYLFTNLQDYSPCRVEIFTREMTHLYDRLSQREKVVKEIYGSLDLRLVSVSIIYVFRTEKSINTKNKGKKYDNRSVFKKTLSIIWMFTLIWLHSKKNIFLALYNPSFVINRLSIDRMRVFIMSIMLIWILLFLSRL